MSSQQASSSIVCCSGDPFSMAKSTLRFWRKIGRANLTSISQFTKTQIPYRSSCSKVCLMWTRQLGLQPKWHSATPTLEIIRRAEICLIIPAWSMRRTKSITISWGTTIAISAAHQNAHPILPSTPTSKAATKRTLALQPQCTKRHHSESRPR